MSLDPLTLAEGMALAACIDARDGTRPAGVICRQQRVRLAWSGERRWSMWAAPCVHCAGVTHGRDDQGLPVHPGCVEAALATRFTQEWRS
jgi:hypothetical protein